MIFTSRDEINTIVMNACFVFFYQQKEHINVKHLGCSHPLQSSSKYNAEKMKKSSKKLQ